VNRVTFADIKEDMFISTAFLKLNCGAGTVTLARAGHDPPLLYRGATGRLEVLEPPGMALGIDSGPAFDRVLKEQTVAVEPGDCILLYTDGATEARDSKNLEFGVERLSSAFRHTAPQGANAVLTGIQRVLNSFVGGYQQIDDITLIAIEKR
jgi:sigma-B regulation protein RsbU (phosphoserine phosphatase)